MATIFEPEDRGALLERLALLRPDATPRWGTMDAGQVLAHLRDAVRYAAQTERGLATKGPMSVWPLNRLVIHVLPWPKGRAESPPAFLGGTVGDWKEELAALADRLETLGVRGAAGDWPPSPSFGRISGHDWGVLLWRHTDHHLRQFGL